MKFLWATFFSPVFALWVKPFKIFLFLKAFLCIYLLTIFTVLTSCTLYLYRHFLLSCVQTPSVNGFLTAEVPLAGRAGVPDHLPGAHHAVLPHPAGRGPAVLGLLSCGVGWGLENPRLCVARLQGAQWVHQDPLQVTLIISRATCQKSVFSIRLFM